MARTQRQGKRQSNARKQARAVRTKPAATTAEPTTTASDPPSSPSTARATRPYQAGKTTTPTRQHVVTNSLPRDLEYGFIREDLVRLLITSGILAAVMIALLLAVDL